MKAPKKPTKRNPRSASKGSSSARRPDEASPVDTSTDKSASSRRAAPPEKGTRERKHVAATEAALKLAEAYRPTLTEIYESILADSTINHGPSQSEPFRDSIWKEFRPSIAIEILSDQNSSHTLCMVVLAALSTWVVAPGKALLIRQASRRSVYLCLSRMRNRLVARDEDGIIIDQERKAVADAAAILLFHGQGFIHDIYDTIGGFEGVSEFMNYQSFHFDLADAEAALDVCIRLVGVLHYFVTHREAGMRPKMTLKSASEIISELYKSERSVRLRARLTDRQRAMGAQEPRRIQATWALHKETIALAYAAHTMPYEHSNLLGSIQAMTAIGSTAIQEWLRRSRFVASHVLVGFHDEELAKASQGLLLDFDAQPFDSPSLSDTEMALIRKTLQVSF